MFRHWKFVIVSILWWLFYSSTIYFVGCNKKIENQCWPIFSPFQAFRATLIFVWEYFLPPVFLVRGRGGQRHLMTKYDIKNEAANLSSCCEILSRVGIYHHLSEGSTTTYLTDLPPLIWRIYHHLSDGYATIYLMDLTPLIWFTVKIRPNSFAAELAA